MNEHLWTARHLPWYVNGTLVGDDLARAQRHLGECVLCRQDLQEQEALSAAVATPTPPPADAAHALAALHARIDARENGGLRGLFAGTPRAARWVMAVQSVLLVAALGWLAVDRDPPAPAYRTLSEQALPAVDLRIVFAPAFADADRDAWLARHGAKLVRGPGPGGVVAVDWPGEPDAALLDALRRDPDVLFVAPAADGP